MSNLAMRPFKKRPITRAFTVLFSTFLFFIIVIFIWLRGSLPVINGELTAKTILQPVNIIRDKNAVPHIFAKNEKDSFFALGLVHAQDRLWQMELMRRTGAGRLSEIIGNTALPYDKYTRTLGCYKSAKAKIKHLSPKSLELMTAYVAGINHHIENHRGPFSPEFIILQHKPEPWSISDSLVWSCMITFQLSQNWWKELLRLRLNEKFTSEQMQDFWINSDQRSATLNLGEKPKVIAPISKQVVQAVPNDFIPQPASNAWVLSGTRTNTGKPILANDPHLSFSAPVLWYLARLVTPSTEIVGATVPGVPFTILGHNKNIAWGLTTAGGDTQDLFFETLVNGESDHYQTPEGVRKFKIRPEKFKIRNQQAIKIHVRSSRNGVIISDITKLGNLALDNRVLALKTTQELITDRTHEALYRINKARDWSEFRAATKDFHSPHQNIFFADRTGDIGMISAGIIPIRNGWQGRWPANGENKRFSWIGSIPFEDLPQIVNPQSGFLGNANNRVVTEAYKNLITKDWDPPFRAERMLQLARASRKHSMKTSAAWQMDNYSSAAAQLLPIMLAKLPDKLKNMRVVTALKNWDFHMRRNSNAPLIYNAWTRNFMAYLMKPFGLTDLGPRPSFLVQVLLKKPSWCAKPMLIIRESNCSKALEESLVLTIKQLVNQNGEDVDKWRWGNKHKAVFKHQLFDKVPILRRFANLTISSSGGDHTLNRGQTNFSNTPEDPFLHRHGAGYRAIYNLDKLGQSKFIIATGQSGNIFSKFYGNFIRAWRDGSYISISGTGKKLKLNAIGVLHLRPLSNAIFGIQD